MKAADKVLVVDDLPINVALMCALVRNAAELEPVGFTDPLGALRWCERERPVLVLVDFAMPQMSGDDFVRQIRATEDGRLIPVVVVTAHTDRDTLLRAFEAGASDILRKPVDDMEVMARVRSLSQLGRASQQLLALATTDALTGLDNRRRFMAHLDEEVARVRRYGGELSVVMIDVDHFKRINDTAGHAAGDAVLCAIADRMRETIRDTDFVGRLGGEEFAWALPSSSLAEAGMAAERLRHAIEVSSFADGRSVTASLGVATLWPEADAPALLRKADACLYEAKNGGRNRVEMRGA